MLLLTREKIGLHAKNSDTFFRQKIYSLWGNAVHPIVSTYNRQHECLKFHVLFSIDNLGYFTKKLITFELC